MKLHGAAIALTLASSVQAYSPEGTCYRQLGDSMQPHNTYTYQMPTLSMRVCGQQGHRYVAIRGVECYCGSSKPPEKFEVSLENCDTPCRGWPSDKCGGKKAWSVYSTEHFFKPRSSSSRTSTTSMSEKASSTSEV
ncbi:hypothetical protein P170DRAFT_511824 [Aspergillus steynii IBT 23096]|uniref:WSC domain-containing protein n=1 Tax=Aspergillus steynii IBT 23096 TaxID=1392250 RepID=A0A2I2G2S4_9EURO|nr:uncharacterized protein P170DRAFT_511824 [Aspergillus steynii IBT 23096]PLB47184.1 hypothetical protein P170DRAFT_511824 [Aspergillus steynii IBT 23096]